MNKKLFYREDGSGIPLLLIHGFTGSNESFKTSIRYLRQYFKVIAIDMIGHGKSFDKNPNNYSFERSVELIKDILIELNLKKTNLLGYSLGGRLALHLAINSTQLINKLILCSTSPGIKDKSDRKARQNSDSYLADLLLDQGIGGFVDYWESLSLWRSEKRLSYKIKNTMRKIRLSQEPLGLINSLNSQGQGIQKYILKNLKKIQNKTLIFAGEKDEKYIKYSYEIQKNIEDSKVKIVPNSGHNLILENPIYIAKKTKDFILKE